MILEEEFDYSKHYLKTNKNLIQKENLIFGFQLKTQNHCIFKLETKDIAYILTMGLLRKKIYNIIYMEALNLTVKPQILCTKWVAKLFHKIGK